MKRNIKDEFKADFRRPADFLSSAIPGNYSGWPGCGCMVSVISLLIKPLYESTVILYPSSNITEARTLLGESTSRTALFGDDNATEKLIQVVSSEQVRDWLRNTYDLASHYNVKPSEKYPNTVISEKMDRYIRISKTSYGSVEIRVHDRDREIACSMANDMASRADTIFNNLQRKAAALTLDEISRSYEMQDRIVRSYEDTLSSLQGAAALKAWSTLETETEYPALYAEGILRPGPEPAEHPLYSGYRQGCGGREEGLSPP